MNLVRLLVLFVGMQLLLTGCYRFGVDELEDVVPQGTAFQNALSKTYLAFAISEADQYDWSDADHFAKKGLQAANGNDITPELIEDWNIPLTMRPSLENARNVLINTVNDRVKKSEPEMSARAFLLFDCWLEQQEENWQLEHIQSCRDDFFEVMDYLNVRAGKVKKKVEKPVMSDLKFEPVKRKEDLDDKKKDNDARAAYAIFFGSDSAQISKDGWGIIEKIIKELEQYPEYLIKLNGYADRAGNVEYNKTLSELRANAVMDALVKRGVVKSAIEVKSFGEGQPQVKTSDGKQESSNRVVEIFIH